LLRNEVDELAGLDLGRVIGGDAGRDLHLAAVHGRKHDGGALQLVFELVHRFAQRLGVGTVERGGEHLDALDIHRLRQQLVAFR
jgi:hypothetical protein